METWTKVIVLSVGGAIGVNARYWLGFWISRWASPQFPWATLVINVSGSFAVGFLTQLLSRWLPHPNARLLIVVGLLGGYTTFSTFEHETLTLWERGEIGRSLGNLVGSVTAGFFAVFLGVILARGLVNLASVRLDRGDHAGVSSTFQTGFEESESMPHRETPQGAVRPGENRGAETPRAREAT